MLPDCATPYLKSFAVAADSNADQSLPVIGHGLQHKAKKMHKPDVATPTCKAISELFDEPQLDDIRAVTGSAFGDLVAQFQANAVAAFAEIEAAVTAGDAERLRKSSHRFKGSAATIGARAVAEIAGQIEKAGQSGAVNDGERLLGSLREVFEQSCLQLQAMVGSRVA